MKSITEIAKAAILAVHPTATSSAENVEGNSHKMIAKAIALYEAEFYSALVAESKTVSQATQDYIEQSFVGAKNDRREFAHECAMQYGFKALDDEGLFYGVTSWRLSDLMSAIGFRCPGEKRHFHLLAGEVARPVGNCTIIGPVEDVTHLMKQVPDPDTEEKVFTQKTVHDIFDRLLYAFAQDACAAKVGAHLYDLDSFKKLRQAFDKQRMKASIRVDASALRQTLDEALNKVDELKGGSTQDGGEQVDLGGQDGIDLARPRAGGRHHMVRVNQGYDVLASILVEALNQAQQGKGHERHNMGSAIPFERQRMQTVSELIGSVHGMTYQVCKKVTEGVNLPTLDRQVAEMLGAINYLAGMIIFLRKQHSLKATSGPDHEDGPASEGFAADTPYNDQGLVRWHSNGVFSASFDDIFSGVIFSGDPDKIKLRDPSGGPAKPFERFVVETVKETAKAHGIKLKRIPTRMPLGLSPDDQVMVHRKGQTVIGPLRAGDVEWDSVLGYEPVPAETPVGGEAWGGPGAVIKPETIGKSAGCAGGCSGCASAAPAADTGTPHHPV